MRFSWLSLQNSGFIHPWPSELTPEQVAQQLTMVGLELEQLDTSLQQQPILELNITPNRGDCLSIRGICREIAAINHSTFRDEAQLSGKYPPATLDPRLTVLEPQACPFYVGQWFDVPATLPALPAAIVETLMASGLPSIHPIVDLGNYVMLLLGQPLHVFDADCIGPLCVRFAKADEPFCALGDKDLSLSETTLVIADSNGVQALAGVIGGRHSAVHSDTRRIFVESAHFNAANIAGVARHYGLQTDAAYRFERGVDPALPWPALKLFAKLASEHLQLVSRDVVVQGDSQSLTQVEPIFLRAHRIERILGMTLHTGQIEQCLNRLGMHVTPQAAGWQVLPPTCRFDLRIEVDLIEELARMQGYDQIPAQTMSMAAIARPMAQKSQQLATLLVHSAYHEVISYSFISEDLHQLCFDQQPAIRLQNPLSSELALMRISLWPSLLQTFLYQQARQQQRAKLYEQGCVYLPEWQESLSTYRQPQVLAGLMTGAQHKEQWAAKARQVDFYDVKADVEKLLQLYAPLSDYRFVQQEHAMLHPGQAAAIYWGDQLIGRVGRLHPRLQQALAVHQPVYLFELSVDQLPDARRPTFKAFSKFPNITRNFAFFIKRDVVLQDFCDFIKQQLSEHLVDLVVFDVYQGQGVALDEKSIAFSVVLQNMTHTWTDQAISQLSDDLVSAISQRFAARLRDGQ